MPTLPLKMPLQEKPEGREKPATTLHAHMYVSYDFVCTILRGLLVWLFVQFFFNIGHNVYHPV